MSSLYNMLFGKNTATPVILAILGLKEQDVERFRNCSINESGITIYTRTGGGNRKDYPNEKLTSNPCYICDEDDDFDSTYATYYFNFPPELKDDTVKLTNPEMNGIPASIIKKCNEVWSRAETMEDKYTRIYNEQINLYNQLRFSLELYETNGHTIVPLSDDAMEQLLHLAEKNDYEGHEGEFFPYGIRPYKLNFSFEVPKWSSDKNGKLCRIKIDLGQHWVIDQAIWARYKNLFADKYPKAMKAISKWVDQPTATC